MLARPTKRFSRACSCCGIINHDWRRNVIGFNFDRQRCCGGWKLGVLAPWQITAIVATIATVWVGALLAGSPGAAAARIARARFGTRCARLARGIAARRA
jgi:hypothetical protein